jgi:spore coat protein A
MAMPASTAKPQPMLHSLELTPFVDPLPLPERLQPVAHHGQSHKLRVAMREVHAKIHRDVPAARFWGYGTANSSSPLAPVIEARAHQPLEIEWVNALPVHHYLPIDFSLHGCGRELPEVRAIVHVHGARVPTKDDGYPEDWFVPGASRTCHYPLEQDSATLWYHDHAMGLNRLNMYAGLFGLFLIRDKAEDDLNLPSGKYEVPLSIYDRDFTADGQLFYPTSGDPNHPWVPEFYADATLINGKVRPFFEVEPRLYRFRVLNAANSRFFALALSGQTPFHQIGSDQGLLPAPVQLKSLLLAPAERADLLIDFSQFAGQKVHLVNGAFEILQFRVAAKADAAPVGHDRIPAALRPVPRIPESAATVTRTITLNEYQDKVGNPMIMLLNRKHWHDPVTEQPKLNSTEIWEFVNLTEDVHPMHLHLVRFQLLDRRTFEVFSYQRYKKLRYLAPAMPPEPSEVGWKDTIQCPPGTITRIIVHFDGYAGKYLYHCHILEHESNDMMRPFEVVA